MHHQRLIKLYLDNGRSAGGYRIEAKDGEATVYLYEAIGEPFGVSAEAFARDLNTIDARVIHLRVDSPGGDVFAARAMHTAIAQHPARVIAHVDGLAASAASVVIMAAQEIEIARGAFIMIHRPWALVVGDSDDMIKMADLLDKVEETIAADYAGRTGKDMDQIRQWMEAETWFNGDEAVAQGFADRVAEASAKTAARWDLSAYLHPPQSGALNLAPRDHAERERKTKAIELAGKWR